MRGFAHVNWINYPSELQSTLMAVETSRVKKKKKEQDVSTFNLHSRSRFPSPSLADPALRFFQFFPPAEIFVPFHRILQAVSLWGPVPRLSLHLYSPAVICQFINHFIHARLGKRRRNNNRFQVDAFRRVYATLGPLGARSNKRLAKPS